MLDFSAGVLTGLGIAGYLVHTGAGAFSKLMPPSGARFAFGVGTAAGSFGQFLFSPLAVGLIGMLGWQHALIALGIFTLLMIRARSACARRRWMSP